MGSDLGKGLSREAKGGLLPWGVGCFIKWKQKSPANRCPRRPTFNGWIYDFILIQRTNYLDKFRNAKCKCLG